jgi:hypothetical protein
MTDDAEGRDLPAVMRAVETLDSLADTAELMGDLDGAERYRRWATEQRMLAMKLLDD